MTTMRANLSMRSKLGLIDGLRCDGSRKPLGLTDQAIIDTHKAAILAMLAGDGATLAFLQEKFGLRKAAARQWLVGIGATHTSGLGGTRWRLRSAKRLATAFRRLKA